MSGDLKMKTVYSKEESQYYAWIYATCDVDHDGTIGQNIDRLWLQFSQLSPDVLDQVMYSYKHAYTFSIAYFFS